MDQIFLAIQNGKVTQLAEPYAPLIETIHLPLDPAEMIAAGKIKPDMKLVITYGSHDGEDFIESVMYPNGKGLLESYSVRRQLLVTSQGVTNITVTLQF